MNLPEALIAATIFATSAVGSLQVWSASAAWSLGAQRQRDWLVQIDADLQHSEGRMRHLKSELLEGASCIDAIKLMAEAIASTEIPLPPEISRRLEVGPISSSLPGQTLVLKYQVNAPALNASLVRQRQWTAQAFGLCHDSVAKVSP